jgi:hypothetical protein
METLTDIVIHTIRAAASLLTGGKRRRFQAQVALDHCEGNPRTAERVFSWGRQTVETGLGELRSGVTCKENFSARGRKGIEVLQPDILVKLEQLLANNIAGNPMSEEKWVRGSLCHLSRQLKEMGYKAGSNTVARLLRGMGFSRKSNKRRQPRPKCPTRNEQFEYIAMQRRRFSTAGSPLISVDTKKKELIGPFRNKGKLGAKRLKRLMSTTSRALLNAGRSRSVSTT